MNKKIAWTLIELVIAMVFIMLISGFLISVIKPKQQSARIYYYATVRNIEKGLIAVEDKWDKAMLEEAQANLNNYSYNANTASQSLTDTAATKRGLFYEEPSISSKGNDTFCLAIADSFAIKDTPNCTKNTTNPNFTLQNGVTFYGLASTPITPAPAPSAVAALLPSGLTNDEITRRTNYVSELSKYAYKNILIDVDGPKGRNRLGVDRFPLRIYASDNNVLPVNCAETQMYNWRLEGLMGKDGAKTSGIFNMTDNMKNPYCKTGKTFNGATSSQNFMLDTEIVTFDVFQNTVKRSGPDSGKVQEVDTLKYFSRCFAEAVCKVYGGKRFLAKSECDALGYTQEPECVESYEKGNVCYLLPHRHNAGMSAIVKGMIGGDLDMD